MVPLHRQRSWGTDETGRQGSGYFGAKGRPRGTRGVAMSRVMSRTRNSATSGVGSGPDDCRLAPFPGARHGEAAIERDDGGDTGSPVGGGDSGSVRRGAAPSEGALTESERTEAAESVERELVLLFRRVRNLSANVAGHVHPDLDPASYSLLLMVSDAGQLRGMDVADRIGVDKSTVSRQIGTLVELGLLERVPDPDDGRARLVQLSELGRERLTRLRDQRSEHLQGVFESWSTHDLSEFARLLAQLNHVV